MKTFTFYWIGIVLLIFTTTYHLNAQVILDSLPPLPNTEKNILDLSDSAPNITISSSPDLKAITRVAISDFNQANIQHPYQLLQNRVPGLQISQPGSDPNGNYNIRIRGLNTLTQNAEPLIVIDDIPVTSIDQIDPEDIASIEVLRDVASAARYGIRGGGGVIRITSKNLESYYPLRVRLHSFLATDKIVNRLPFAEAQEFVRLGGENLGNETNWVDEITDKAFSQMHHLSLDGYSLNTNTGYRVGLTYRNANGTLKNSGFQRKGAQIKLTQSLFNNKLNIELNGTATETDRLYGFSEAFHYAGIYNPTAPIRENDDFSQQFGGYFQQPIFDYYNPVAIVEQNTNEGLSQRLVGNAKVSFEILNNLKIETIGGQSREEEFRYLYHPDNALYGSNNQVSYSKNTSQVVDNQYISTKLVYANHNDAQDIHWYANLGYDYQEFNIDQIQLSGRGYDLNEFNFTNLTNAKTFRANDPSFDEFGNFNSNTDDYRENHRLAAFFGNVQFDYKNTFSIAASLRREGSSRLGESEKWGWFPAVSGQVNLDKLLNIQFLSQLNLRTSYGIAGNIPQRGGLSIATIGDVGQYFYDGEFRAAKGLTNTPNHNLTYERTCGYNLGVDVTSQNRLLSINIDIYKQRSNDLLHFVPVPTPPALLSFQWQNIAELSTHGVDINLSYRIVDKSNFSWNLNVVYATSKTFLEKFTKASDINGDLITFFLGSSTRYLLLETGKPIGQIIAPEFIGIDENGRLILKDQNGGVDPSDYVLVGNTYPNAEIGFGSQLNYGKLDLNFFFRGSFGHNLVNINRMTYEVNNVSRYNSLQTKYYDPRLTTFNQHNSQIIENASFIRLDNITLGYTFKNKNSNSTYKVYLAARNLFTISGYTGNDPEVRLEGNYFEPVNPWRLQNLSRLLGAGADQPNTYWLSRSLVVGIKLTL